MQRMKTFVFLLVTLQVLSPTLNAPLKDSAEVAELGDAELEPPHDGVHDHEDPGREGKWTFNFNPGAISISDHSFAGEYETLSVGHYANVENIEGNQITENEENVENVESLGGDKITETNENVGNVNNVENVETASGLSAAGVSSSAAATTTTTTAAATTITTTAAAATITTTAAAATITTTAAATTITTTAAATTTTTTAAATTTTTTTTAAATTATTTAATTTATTTAATTTATTTAATTTATTTAAATTTTTAATTTIVSCRGGATRLSTSPRRDMVLCKDKTESTCERDFESLCPAGWNLCHPKQFNNRNQGWDYNLRDAKAGNPLGVIYCTDKYGDGSAAHYGIYSNPVLSTDTPLNCGWISSRPGCDQFAGLYDCDNKDESALCCAPTSTCGDGQVQQEEEDCDDGNDSNRDNCLNSCTFRIPSINGHGC